LIITVSKPFEKILSMLEPFDGVFIVGCGDCATVCQTGGEKQVEDMARRVGKVKDVAGTAIVETTCDERLVKRDLSKIVRERQPEAFLVMACGVGVQTLSEAFDVTCIPALDTKFLGKVERIGRFFERCKACGDCVLYDTGGICPVTRCAKGLLNGPCGGQADGKCEVGGWQNDCAWALIYERLKKLGTLDRFKEFRQPRDHRLKAGPGELVWR
jgi:ferredoxin